MKFAKVKPSNLGTKIHPSDWVNRVSKDLTLAVMLCVGTVLYSNSTFSIQSDHIGPDPVQSENCLIVTPGRSLVCRGYYVPPEPKNYPTISINCHPGISLILTHESVPVNSSNRKITLRSDADQMTLEWLAVSDTQSAIFVFYMGRESRDYEFIITALGRLLDPLISSFDLTLDDQSLLSYFEFDVSDQALFYQIADNCGR